MTAPSGTATLRRLDRAGFEALCHADRGFREPALDDAGRERLARLLGRETTLSEAVRIIVEEVRVGGDDALREWTRRLDGVIVDPLLAGADEMAAAWEQLPHDRRDAWRTARDRVAAFHRHQLDLVRPVGTPSARLVPMPVRRAGLYVPGGRAAYPSTAVMLAVPALIAGVEDVVITTPPSANGRPHPDVLAVAHIVGVRTVVVAGGAQAIAALAFGTATVPRVDVIAGPGNLVVTLAKKLVAGSEVAIDGLAGPSEIMVVATTGDPAMLAADLVSQLEHDPLAWAVFVTDDPVLAAAVETAFSDAVLAAKRRGIVEEAAGRHGACVLVADMEEALAVADEFAPEHIELVGSRAEALQERLRTSGSIFVGIDTPVPMGDYLAGPNHTLPTGGAARFTSPVGILTFTRWSSITQLTHSDIVELGPVAQVLSESEGLHGHTESIRLRLDARSAGAGSDTVNEDTA